MVQSPSSGWEAGIAGVGTTRAQSAACSKASRAGREKAAGEAGREDGGGGDDGTTAIAAQALALCERADVDKEPHGGGRVDARQAGGRRLVEV